MSEFRAQDNELQPLSAQLDSVEREAGEDETECSSKPSIDQAKWSRSPRKLTNNARSSPFATSLDAILACFPILFLVLAILAIRLDGTQISQYGDGIIQATQLLPSVFPIVFAAIVGGLMRNYALWRAQNCAPLGVLEQLNGSSSFAGTVSSILALRHATLLSVSVLLLWAMSPIGGQSALRMVSQAASSVSGNASAAYINMNGSSYLIGFSAMTAGLTPTNAVYTASLLASQEVKDSPRDLWGWPKIPLLRTLPPVSSSRNSANPWRSSVSNDSIIYSSLAGIVLQGIPRDLDAEFSVESSYLDLDCHLVANDSTDQVVYEIMGKSVLVHNATDLFEHPTYHSIGEVTMSSFFIDTTYNFTAPARNQANVNLFYGSRNRLGEGPLRAALFNCSISYVHVESWIACQNYSCAVNRMRQSENDRRPSSYTPWHDLDLKMTNNWVTLYNFITELPAASGPIASYAASPTDSYIYGEPSLFSLKDYHRDWSSVSEHDVSTRLTTVFNTYWQASLAPLIITTVSASDPVRLSIPPQEGLANFNSTFCTTSRAIRVYRTKFGWVSVFIFGAILLQFCAVAALSLKSMTIAPDILGYVSSMTRENPHIPLPPGGSSYSGPERARLLRDLKVQILDVQGYNDTGHIALASRDTVDMMGQKLNRRREYG
ncbi:hypothetical protein Aspvir_002384 [Aspergillus viridinutans]|uniref:Uncharacterized protein n=1 Tax=Aspergillus viridinutans TaxID=75553 RepID=A0A9P3F698_ASPVI|nr:uncharacterized protein Aspvir_002384 [Aspergillus viridinutans]GIK06734.1 hypothetical protein Aspvir_002384 [Aspergillus viridinutans]